ncbi:MAG: thioredoxin TrxC [Gammaproteobacteria bacterium]|nr:thioredoxin TrxC [Gammaproteobacteria bacterium]
MSQAIHIVCPECGGINRLPQEKLLDGGKCGKCAKALFNAHPVSLNGQNFARFITKNDIPVLVDFWAPWCGPCKMMAPVFERAAQKLEPGMRLAKVNTEEQQMLAGQYNIRSIPTLAIFKQGKEIARTAGAMDLASLLNWAGQYRLK